ncbi:hypothetical protein V8E51_002668 [Hyaloscypha variabilis]
MTGFRPPSDMPLLETNACQILYPWNSRVLYCVSKGAWEIFLFLAGIILAEMRHVGEGAGFRLERLVGGGERVRCARRAINTFWVLIFITSLYTASIPVMGSLVAPGFCTLASWAPTPFQVSGHLRAACILPFLISHFAEVLIEY